MPSPPPSLIRAIRQVSFSRAGIRVLRTGRAVLPALLCLLVVTLFAVLLRHRAATALAQRSASVAPASPCEDLSWAREIVDAYGTGRVLSFDKKVCFIRQQDRSLTRIELIGVGKALVTEYPADCELAFWMARSLPLPADPQAARQLAVDFGLIASGEGPLRNDDTLRRGRWRRVSILGSVRGTSADDPVPDRDRCD